MGSVSTALTEDALSKCLERSIYQFLPPEGADLGSSGDNDDVICSICQVLFFLTTLISLIDRCHISSITL